MTVTTTLTEGPVMTWCLSWWTPDGSGQLIVAAAFWGGLAMSGLLLVRRRLRASRAETWHHLPVDEAASTREAAGRSRR